MKASIEMSSISRIWFRNQNKNQSTEERASEIGSFDLKSKREIFFIFINSTTRRDKMVTFKASACAGVFARRWHVLALSF